MAGMAMIGARFVAPYRMHWPASAQHPVAVAAAITAALPELGSTVVIGSITAAQAISYVAVTAAVVGLSYALAPTQPQVANNPGASQVAVKQAIPPRFRSYGTVKVAGVIAFAHVDGNSLGRDANLAGDFWEVLLQGQGRIDSVIEHWLEDRQIVFAGSTTIPADTATLSSGGISGGYNIATIENKLGDADQTAHQQLVDIFPTFYSSADRWRGVPTTMLKLNAAVDTASAQAVYPSGPLKYRQVQRAALVYDPRDADQIADGNPDDPVSAGWGWSDNAALVILDFLRHPDGWGRRSARTMLPITRFRIADWIAFADLSDQDVALRVAGTVKRYRLAGSYNLTDAPKTILRGMLDACDADIYRHGDGTIGIRGGAWSDPTVTIADADIISHTLSAGSRKSSACNIIRAKYTSPPHDYQQQDMDPWIDQENIDLRGEELSTDIDLTWCPSHAQARRVSKIAMAKRNPAWQGTLVTGPRGLLAFNEPTIRVQIADYGIDETFLLTGFEPAADLATVKLTIAELDASAYAWDPEEEGTPPQLTALDADDSTVPVPNNVTVIISSGVATLTWDANNPVGFTLNYEAQAEDSVSGDHTPMRVSENALQATFNLEDGHTYTYRVRAISPGGQPCAWQYAS